MSIIIQNIGGEQFGTCTYELRINEKVITHFKHHRPDGLAVCLKKASEAAEKAKWMEMKQFVDALKEGK